MNFFLNISYEQSNNQIIRIRIFKQKFRIMDFLIFIQALEQVEVWDAHIESCLLSRAGTRVSQVPGIAPTKLKLTSLTSTAEYVREEGLDTAVRLCPDTRAVSISNAWLPNEALYKVNFLGQKLNNECMIRVEYEKLKI